MKESFLILTPENEAEGGELAIWLKSHEGRVFLVEGGSVRGGNLQDLGSREEVCHLPINIIFGEGERKWWTISNLAHTPFMLHGRMYASVEAFLQGLQFSEQVDRDRVATLYGTDAKRAGHSCPPNDQITYERNTYRTGTHAHWALIELACRAKFSQNASAQQALLDTGERPLTNNTSRDSVTIPGVIMAEIWTRIRSALRNGEGGDWTSLAAEPQRDNRILFFARDRSEFGFLSHFHPSPIVLDGLDWPTVEHYFQAQKSLDPAYHAAIRSAETPAIAKRLSAIPAAESRAAQMSWFIAHQAQPRPDWDQVKLDVMRKADFAKFDQNPDLEKRLLATGDAKIEEDSPYDEFWGTGRHGDGLNWAGRVLMEVRAALMARSTVLPK